MDSCRQVYAMFSVQIEVYVSQSISVLLLLTNQLDSWNFPWMISYVPSQLVRLLAILAVELELLALFFTIGWLLGTKSKTKHLDVFITSGSIIYKLCYSLFSDETNAGQSDQRLPRNHCTQRLHLL